MSRFVILLPLLIGYALPGEAPAAQPDACKACRDDHQACTKAHSKEACKTNYDICLRHCRPQDPRK